MMNPHSPTGRVLRSLFLMLVLLAVGSGGAGLLWLVRVEPPRHELVSAAPAVETMVVRVEDIVERYVGYGTVRPIRTTDVAAEVSAQVIERVGDIRAGSRVSESQPLFRLDARQFELTAERARSRAAAEQASLDELTADERSLSELRGTAKQELLVARHEKERVTSLFEHDMAAKKEYDFANLSYRQAQRVLLEYNRQAAKLPAQRARIAATKRGFEQDAAIAQLNIDRCEIRAPFAGSIKNLTAETGDHVAPGTVVATLVDDARVEIPIQLPAADYDRALFGAPCRLTTENRPERVWHGEIVRIDPVANATTRTFAVYIEVDNTRKTSKRSNVKTPEFRRLDVPTFDPVLFPGLFVRAEVRGAVHRNRLLLPREICRDGHVFVVENGLAKSRPIKTEGFLEDRAIVTGSLTTGDTVILSHLDRLVDGSPVRVHPPRTATSDPSYGTSPRRGGAVP